MPSRNVEAASPNIAELVVEVSCSKWDTCAAIDRGDTAATVYAITAEAGAHLSSDLTSAGLAADANGKIDAVRVVCQTDHGWSPTCVLTDEVGALPAGGHVILTGVGAELSWTQAWKQVDNGEAFTDVETYELTYDDAFGYFGGAASVSAVAVPTTHVAHHGGYPDAPQTSSFEVPLTQVAPHVYRGTITVSLPGWSGDSQTDLDHLGVAFHAGATWDSNLSRNYDF